MVSCRRLYSSLGQKLNFDQFVLIIESVKLMIYLIFSFLVFHQSLMIYVQILQTSIQFLICLSFLRKVFNIAGLKSVEKFVVGSFATAFTGTMVVCIFMTQKINCDESTLGKVWVVFIVCGVVQSLLIAASSLFLIKTMK